MRPARSRRIASVEVKRSILSESRFRKKPLRLRTRSSTCSLNDIASNGVPEDRCQVSGMVQESGKSQQGIRPLAEHFRGAQALQRGGGVAAFGIEVCSFVDDHVRCAKLSEHRH